MMKKFKVVYIQDRETNLFKVLAENKKHAAEIFRRKISNTAHIINVVEVKNEYRKSWAEINIAVACGIAILLIVLLSITCCEWRIPTPVDYDAYIVQTGDTLWEIGSMSNGWNHFDNTCIIEHIQERSNVTALIYPGQVVYVPIYEFD